MSENGFDRIDFLVTAEEALDMLSSVSGCPSLLFGPKAIRDVLKAYEGEFGFSYTTADSFIRNLMKNMKGLGYGHPTSMIGNARCDEETLKELNKLLREYEIQYHFELVKLGSDTNYLRCTKGYLVEG